jgi:hypothetical protein
VDSPASGPSRATSGTRRPPTLTISAAAFSLALAALKPHERSEAARTRWANWNKLAHDAEDFVDLDLPTLDEEAGRRQLVSLRDRHHELRRTRGAADGDVGRSDGR